MRPKAVLVTKVKVRCCAGAWRPGSSALTNLDGRCASDGNFCNLLLPALRETQPQLEFWHALILLAPVLLVLLALGATLGATPSQERPLHLQPP